MTIITPYFKAGPEEEFKKRIVRRKGFDLQFFSAGIAAQTADKKK
jgi:hypothetical protein